MAARSSSTLPTPTEAQRKIAAENYERARKVLQDKNYDYAIQMLMLCCRVDPANIPFRQLLRRAQKEKYGNSLRGSRFAFFSTPKYKARMKKAKMGRDHIKVLEYAEEVLYRNPWDMGTSMEMAEAFEALGLLDLAVYSLDQARQKYATDATLNRALARLFEKRGDFQKAIVLWQIVQKANPRDVEAANKSKDLAASETIARGGYEEAAAGTKESPVLGKMEATANEKQDKLGKETAALLKRIETAPTEPSLYTQLAALYRRHNQLDRARATLQQGLGPTGNDVALQLELHELDLLPLRTNLDHAESKLKQLIAIPEDDRPEGQPTEQELLKLKNKITREIAAREAELFRLKADRFPHDLIHRLELGVRLMRLDKVDEAIGELQRVRKDDKLKGKAAMFLGIGFRKRNNWPLAQRNFEEALQALSASEDSSRKEVLFQLATGNADNNDLPRAMELGQELANIDFGYKNIGQLLDEWQARSPAK
jgi:tetratricopeptide (TPR) repeat protein